MTQLWISAGLIADEEKSLNDVKQALSDLRTSTLEEQGCIQFEIMQNKTSPNCFTLWEGWINEAALEAHFQTPHTQAYLTKELTTVKYIERLTPLNNT